MFSSIAPAERDALLGDVVLALMCPEAEFDWDFEVPSGRAALERRFFGPIVAALARGPRLVRELLALPERPRHDHPSEPVGMLVGTDQTLPLLAPPAEPDQRVNRFNRLAAKYLVRSGNLNSGSAPAASGSGAPVPCTMLVAARLAEEQRADPASRAVALGTAHPEAEQQRLCAFIERLIAERAPLWHRLGALAALPR